MTQPDDERDPETDFGALVRDMRRDRGWTQDQLRRALLQDHGIDLSKTAMARLEQGKRPIRLNEVAALAKVLNFGLGQLDRPDPVKNAADLAGALANEMTVKERLDTDLAAIEGELANITLKRDEVLSARARTLGIIRNLEAALHQENARARRRADG